MTLEKTTPPPVLAAQHPKQKYHKPSFEVIEINMESNLLTSSGTPTPKINPIKPSNESW